jgi:DNA-binding XRE family transcriptional regulator
MHASMGAQLLSRHLEETGRTRTDLARSVGCHQTTIGRICSGEVVPSIEVATAIQRETQIPIESWIRSAGEP